MIGKRGGVLGVNSILVSPGREKSTLVVTSITFLFLSTLSASIASGSGLISLSLFTGNGRNQEAMDGRKIDDATFYSGSDPIIRTPETLPVN